MLTDTHVHLAHPALFFRLPEIFAQARQHGVTRFIAPAAEHADWARLLELQRQPEIRAAAIGIHPWYAQQATPAALAELDACLHRHPALLVGEIGLDFYDKTQTPEARACQIQAFQDQLAPAQTHRRPVILHSLRAAEAVIRCVRHTRFTQGGIAHAFSGSLEEAALFMRHGFKIGIGALLLNPNAKKTRAAAQKLPLNALLLETDSPFGRPEHTATPARLRQIAETAAQLRGIAPAELAAACGRNLAELLDEKAA